MAIPTSLRYLEPQAITYRRTWRASVFSNFLNPVLYLLAMGAGLGSLVDENADPSGLGIPYLAWLGPGLLAAQAMQTAWIAVRVFQVSAIYAAILVAFGITEPLGALLGTLTATLTGVAFAGPIMAFTSRLEDDPGLSHLFRFVVVPLFLFSGTFFPISQLPELIRPVAYVTPLWHGVELSRLVAIGIETTFPWWVSVGVLLLWAAVGTALALPQFRRRLVV